MERDEELRRQIEGLLVEARERLGSPPTPEEILAYQEGRLTPTDRLRVEEGVAAFPEAARLLRDLACFPDIQPTPGVTVPTAAEIDTEWRGFRERLAAARRPGEEARGSEPPYGSTASSASPRVEPQGTRGILRSLGHASRPPAILGKSRPARSRRWLQVAALVALSAGLGLGIGRLLPRPEGRINLALASLRPVGDGTTRGTEAVVRISDTSEGVLLSLSYAGLAPHREYSLTIRDATGKAVWRRRGLTAGDEGPFLVVLPKDLLQSGRYRLELSVPGEPNPMAVYALRVAVE